MRAPEKLTDASSMQAQRKPREREGRETIGGPLGPLGPRVFGVCEWCILEEIRTSKDEQVRAD